VRCRMRPRPTSLSAEPSLLFPAVRVS